jgi:hypothetical protein
MIYAMLRISSNNVWLYRREYAEIFMPPDETLEQCQGQIRWGRRQRQSVPGKPVSFCHSTRKE